MDNPEPVIKRRTSPSLVWIIPLLTAVIGGWLIVKTLSDQGPSISINFRTAEGIEAGKTRIKYKNVDIGMVESVEFSEDFSGIILHAKMVREAESFLRRDARFWVVKPQLGIRGVSGLSTLVSGAYIEMEPGQGAPQRHFFGLESPPVVKADEAGRKLVLMSRKLGSVDTGSPIYYQGINAGEVLGYELANDQKSVYIYAFVKAPYDQLVRGNTRFWNVSGVDVSVNADGVNLRTESLQSLLFGGIAFDTPDTLEPQEDDVDGLVYTLYDSYRSIEENTFTKKLKFVLFFDGSVRGLNVDAPVEFKGIKIGRVADVRLVFDRQDSSFRIPVLIEIEPERIVESGQARESDPNLTVKALVERGLRARLETGNLLTGQLFVDLDMHPETPVRLVNEDMPYPELPTISASLEELRDSVRNVLAKLEKVELDRIGSELLGILEGGNALINAPEMRAAVVALKASLSSFQGLLGKLDARAEPVTDHLDQALVSGHQALQDFQKTLGLLDRALDPDSPLQYRVIDMAGELGAAARAVRNLLDLLERNPQSLIFGKSPQGGE